MENYQKSQQARIQKPQRKKLENPVENNLRNPIDNTLSGWWISERPNKPDTEPDNSFHLSKYKKNKKI